MLPLLMEDSVYTYEEINKNPGKFLDKFFVSAQVYILIPENNSYKLLLTQRAESISMGGMISPPGGRLNILEGGELEEPELAAAREALEEVNITLDENNLLKIGRYFSPRGYLANAYLAFADKYKLKEIKIDSQEVINAFLVDLDEFGKNSSKILTSANNVKYSYMAEEIYPEQMEILAGTKPSEKAILPAINVINEIKDIIPSIKQKGMIEEIYKSACYRINLANNIRQ